MSIGRNDPCPCGSGRKFKKCCLRLRPGPARTPPPDSAEAHFQLGNALRLQGKGEGAAAAYRKAIALQADHTEAHTNLGGVLLAANKHTEAIEFLKRALELSGEPITANLNLALAYQQCGDFAEALACFQRVLDRDGDHAQALYELALNLREKMPETDVARMQRLLQERAELPERDRYYLHAGLANVFDALGHYREAARHMQQANELEKIQRRQHGQDYDCDQFTRFVDRSIETYTPEYFHGVRGFGIDTEKPVFMVGLPRSGTTLTERILAGHPQVFGAGELPHVGRSFMSLPKITGIQAEPIDCVEHLQLAAARRMARSHLEQLESLDGGCRRIVDKAPANAAFLGLIATLFPKAKIIHVRRDVRDVAVSCWMTQFDKLSWACEKAWIAAQIGNHLRIMAHWREVLPVPMLEVDYESIVADLAAEAARLIDWIGLPWHRLCLAFNETKAPVKTASIRQVRQPLHSRSVGRWRHYADDLGDLFDELPGKAALVR